MPVWLWQEIQEVLRGRVRLKSKRLKREPRPTPPTEVPLDDGAREGTDAWREIEGVRFCHWDRWLLRLALDEPEGLRSIAREFRRRAAARRGREVAEAMTAQLVALEGRLAKLQLAPAGVLDDVERASTWLHKKAFRRVWHATSIRHTPEMARTPRKLLAQRALTGNWSAFPVSPEPYFAELTSIVGDGWYDCRGAGLVVTLLETAAERLLWSAKTDDERLAIERAMLAASIDAMERVDDSLDELGQHFRDHEHAYLNLLRGVAERPGLLRDLLELSVWEDYGLFHGLEPFLRSLTEPQADLALRELANIIAELRANGLEYQLGRARRLRRAIVAAADGFSDAVEVEP
jgi:hypothetical protein